MSGDRSCRIRVEISGRLARVTLDRPPLNILDILAIHELAGAIERILSDPAPDVILFTGAGDRGFSAGVDIRDHTPDRVEEMLAAFHDVFHKLASCNRVTVAAVRGVCLGGGFELAAFCDIVVCEENARLGLPEIEVGCFPPVAAASFHESAGWKKTSDWILTGRPIGVSEAESAGLVSRVVPTGGLEAAVDELTRSLLAKSSAVLRVTVRLLREGRSAAFAAAIERAEKAYLGDLSRTEDLHEGVASFIEKRKPIWKHR